jgi:hypothetical protein
MLRRGWFVVVAFVVAAGCFGPGGAKVVNPGPVAAAGSLESTEQAIIDTLPKRGWTTETVEPGRIVAYLPVRQFMLRVEIRYDAQQVQVLYVDSDNLQAETGKDGNVYAHKKVNTWMKKLANELREGLATAAASPTSGGVAVPPAEPALQVPASSGAAPHASSGP